MSIFNFLKDILKKKSDNFENIIDDKLACAILLIEVSYSDFKIEKIEINSIIKLFEENFKLSKEKAEWLTTEALNLHKDINCLRKFIKIINDSYDESQKINLINMAWTVARADDLIDKYEEHRIRKLCDFLYVDHADFIKAKINTNI